MQKIPTLFERDPEDTSRVLPVIHPAAEWLLEDTGVPYEKYDGTAVLVTLDGFAMDDWQGRVFKRRTLKSDQTPETVEGWFPAQQDRLDNGKWPGWEPVTLEDPHHIEGFRGVLSTYGRVPAGTYELVGPKVQSNPYRLPEHTMWSHRRDMLVKTVRLPMSVATGTIDEAWYDYIKQALTDMPMEGIVWHDLYSPKMVKIKARDFGIDWPRKS